MKGVGFFLIACLHLVLSQKIEPKIVCYYTNWSGYRIGNGKFVPSNIDPSLCTHILYAFAVLDRDTLQIKSHDTWADINLGYFKQVTALKEQGAKVLLAIGGWNDSAGDKWSRMVNDPGARRKFIGSVINFLETHNFDGLDLDWEYPKCWQANCRAGPQSDKVNFGNLMKELKAEFESREWLLSAAVSANPSTVDAGYDIPAMEQALDFVNLMTYDYASGYDPQTGHVAPLPSVERSVKHWIDGGLSPSKIILGIPAYGKSFTLSNPRQTGLGAPAAGPAPAGPFTGEPGTLSFYEICQKIKEERWRTEVTESGPIAYGNRQWVGYDDPKSAAKKIDYLTREQLGGAMLWTVDFDDFRDTCGCGNYPILKTINQVLREGVPSSEIQSCP